ncbi:MAG: hypothetical protein KGI25_06635 [Thaumarchaeota archaeon]|nr:hypothetical protein [Nitrososphaerota archaeon]
MLAGAKYVYLIVFFALLSGVFYPVITHSAWDPVVIGTIILFIGMTGAVALYKAATGSNHKRAYLIIGLAIMAITMFLIYAAIGRV